MSTLHLHLHSGLVLQLRIRTDVLGVVHDGRMFRWRGERLHRLVSVLPCSASPQGATAGLHSLGWTSVSVTWLGPQADHFRGPSERAAHGVRSQ